MKRAALFLFLPLAGCGPGKFDSKTESPNKPVTWGIRNEVLSLDPVRANEENTASVVGQVAEPLVTIDPTGKVLPCLADRWTSSGDRVEFHLIETSFADGSPLTAKDVKASMERALDPKLLGKEIDTYLGKVRSVEAVNDRTVVFHLKEPTRAIVPMLSSPQLGILPARLRNTPIDDPKDLVGTGPYRMSEYRPNERIVLEPNAKWRGGRVGIPRIEVVPVKDPSALINRFEASDVDILQVASNNVDDVLSSAKLKSSATILPSTKVIYLFFQPSAYPPAKDPRFRQAIAMSLNRERLATDLIRGQAAAADRILPPGLAPHQTLIPKFDPEGARRLLAEAGYPEGKGLPPMSFVFHEANHLNATVQFLPTSLKSELGIRVLPKSTLAFLEEASAHRIPIGLSGWGAPFPDPQAVLGILLRSDSGSNYSGYASPEFDAAERKAEISGKAEDFDAAEKIAARDLPIIPLYVQPKLWLTNSRVKGVVLSTYGPPDFTKASLGR